jgi:hypothetical protein
MKLVASLAFAALASFAALSQAATTASAPAAKAAKPAACKKGEAGGIVASNKMEGDTNVLTIKGQAAAFRIRKADDAKAFESQKAAKVGSLFCVHDDGQ